MQTLVGFELIANIKKSTLPPPPLHTETHMYTNIFRYKILYDLPEDPTEKFATSITHILLFPLRIFNLKKNTNRHADSMLHTSLNITHHAYIMLHISLLF